MHAWEARRRSWLIRKSAIQSVHEYNHLVSVKVGEARRKFMNEYREWRVIPTLYIQNGQMLNTQSYTSETYTQLFLPISLQYKVFIFVFLFLYLFRCRCNFSPTLLAFRARQCRKGEEIDRTQFHHAQQLSTHILETWSKYHRVAEHIRDNVSASGGKCCHMMAKIMQRLQ